MSVTKSNAVITNMEEEKEKEKEKAEEVLPSNKQNMSNQGEATKDVLKNNLDPIAEAEMTKMAALPLSEPPVEAREGGMKSQVLANLALSYISSNTKAADLRNKLEIPAIGWLGTGGMNDVSRLTAPSMVKLIDSIFRIEEQLPRFIDLEKTSNFLQNPNEQTIALTNTTLPQIVESITLFDANTMLLRYKLRKELFGMNLPELFADPTENLFYLTKFPGSTVDYTPTAKWASQTALNFLFMLDVTSNYLVKLPDKITLAPESRRDFTQDFGTFSFTAGDYPHLYLAQTAETRPWLSRALINLYAEAPMSLAETDVLENGGIKYAATRWIVTDQYASEISRINYRKWRASQLTTDEYILRISANVGRDDRVQIQSVDYSDLKMLYRPNQDEWRLAMITLLSSASVRSDIMRFYSDNTTALNWFKFYDPSDVFSRANVPLDTIATTVFSTLLRNMSVGLNHEFSDMILFETFSWAYDFDLQAGADPVTDLVSDQLLSLLTFAIMFPRLFQNLSARIGYKITCLLNVALADEMQAWLSRYGWWSELRDGVWVTSPVEGTMISQDNIKAGIIPSIFAVHPDVRQNPVPATIRNLINSIREICTVNLDVVRLDRKAAARYPYWNDNFEFARSWTLMNFADTMGVEQTALTRRFMTALTVCTNVLNMRTNATIKGATYSKQAATYFQTMMDTYRRLIPSAGSLVNFSMPLLQDMIANSFAMVYDGYNRDSPFVPSRDLTMISSRPLVNYSGLPFQKEKVIINPMIAMRILFTGEGIFPRPIVTTKIGSATGETMMASPAKEVLTYNGLEFDRKAMGLVDIGRRMNLALNVFHLLSSPDINGGPLQELRQMILSVGRMSTLIPILKAIFNNFGLDFTQIFTCLQNPNIGIVDARGIQPEIRYMNPQTNRPSDEMVPNSIIGRRFTFTEPHDAQLIEVLDKLMCSPTSPLNPKATGLAIGRFVVDEQAAVNNALYVQFPNEVDTADIEYRFEPSKNGTAPAIRVNGVTYLSPYGPDLNALRITCSGFSEIPMSHRDFLAKALVDGRIAIMARDQVYRVGYSYYPSRAIDYSQPPTMEKMVWALGLKEGEIPEIVFPDTTFATNYTGNLRTVTRYQQSFLALNPPKDQIFAAVLADVVDRLPQTVLPTGDALGAGRIDGDGNLVAPSGVRKIDLDLINFNNPVPMIGKGVIEAKADISIIQAAYSPVG